METNQIVFRHWEDLVFENRNKLYGAYLLRRTYKNHVLSGLGLTVFVVLMILLWHAGSKGVVAENLDPPVFEGGIIRVLPPPPSIKLERTLPKREPRKSNSSGPVVVTREEVEDEVELEPVIDFVPDDGTGTGDIVPIEGNGGFALPEPEPAIETGPINFAEVMPQYEGGLEAMMKFIQKKIRYPRVPRQLGIEGTVYVGFVVAGDGSVTDVHIIKGVHPDYDEEAIRVISMLPLWKGGSHNGRPVSVRMVLPIKFNLQK